MVGLGLGIKHDYLVTWNSILARRAVSWACSRGVGDTFRSRIFWVRTRAPPGRPGLHPLPRPTARYLRRKHPRSVLCVPIVKQSKLVGVLYLENNLTPRAFTSDRAAVLELLAAQAAISLENAGLYSDLQ